MRSETVLFRMCGEDLIAVFPELSETFNPNECLSYMHAGQHGVSNLALVVKNSRPATPDEYRELKAELVGRGYRLSVQDRIGPRDGQRWFMVRLSELARSLK